MGQVIQINVSVTDEQLDKITRCCLRENPRKPWTLAERKKLARELLTNRVVDIVAREYSLTISAQGLTKI